MLPRTMVSSKKWKLLDRLGRANTSMSMYYSAGTQSRLDALLRQDPRDAPPPAGTSIRHTLLSEDVVARLHEVGLRIFAWTVNTEDRARQLLEWGVDGIISDDVNLFDAVC
jgi:glycerophosphoryl diester phosphodiesterase